jgi:molybdopterin/thiamine biosynthesis adenylyltransferase/rhodanese-related sulfurtransferase
MMTDKEIQRYSRQTILPGFNQSGQEKLKAAKVLVIGAGGLGSPVLQYLAAAGIGRIGIVDGDAVDISNLHRQLLYNENDLGKNKAIQAAEKIALINPFVKTDIYAEHLNNDNALEIIASYDIVLDGTDNFPTRYLINDACVILDKPNVFASINQFNAQVSIFNVTQNGKRGVNYRDLYPTPPRAEESPSCAEVGVLGVLPGIAGSVQALEAIKLIAGLGDALINKLWMYDALKNQSTALRLSIDEQQKDITELQDYQVFCDIANVPEISSIDAKSNWNDYEFIDVRTADKHAQKNIGGINIPIEELHNRLAQLDKNKKYICYCSTGNKSKTATHILLKNGFPSVQSLIGGVENFPIK